MSEQEKQPLTPEELIARKGDNILDHQESPCGDASVTPTAQHATIHTNGAQPATDSVRTIANAAPPA